MLVVCCLSVCRLFDLLCLRVVGVVCCCMLLVVGCLLCDVCYLLIDVVCGALQLFVVCCLLFVVGCRRCLLLKVC